MVHYISLGAYALIGQQQYAPPFAQLIYKLLFFSNLSLAWQGWIVRKNCGGWLLDYWRSEIIGQ